MDGIVTAETAPEPSSEDQMGTHVSRLARPFILAAPLMVAALLPAAVYGQRSNDVAANADRALIGSIMPTGDGTAVTLDPEMLCDPLAAAGLSTTFAELDLHGDSHKASVTGLGFDAVIVDVEGWVDEATGPDRDDIAIRLERTDGDWCVADVTVLGGDPA